MSIFSLLSPKRLAIDLGTANSHVWSSGQGVVLSEPSVVALDSVNGKVVAVGSQAYEMLGRAGIGANLVAQKPLRDGVVADYLVCESMLKYFLDKVLGKPWSTRLMKPEVMVCVPSGITQVERRAVMEATLAAGAKTAYLIEHTLAAAIGAKLPIDAAVGSMVVDIGAGQTSAAVVSLGGIVVSATSKIGGAKLDEAIATYIRRTHNLIIGEKTAESIKIKLGSAKQNGKYPLPIGLKRVVEVKGRDAILGMPRTINIEAGEISEAMTPVLVEIIACIKNVLEQIPPELASDIIDRGIVLSGGTSQLKNLDRLISTQTGVSAYVAEDPMRCVVYGTGVALENIDKWKRVIQQR